MPLIICPDCQARISDSAPACPNCGRPMGYGPPAHVERPRDRGRPALLGGTIGFAVGYFLAFAACGAQPGGDSATVGGSVTAILIFGLCGTLFGILGAILGFAFASRRG